MNMKCIHVHGARMLYVRWGWEGKKNFEPYVLPKWQHVNLFMSMSQGEWTTFMNEAQLRSIVTPHNFVLPIIMSLCVANDPRSFKNAKSSNLSFPIGSYIISVSLCVANDPRSFKNAKSSNLSFPIGSMELVDLPTFTIKINYSCRWIK